MIVRCNFRWVSNNPAGAFDSPLKLVMAGSRNLESGTLLEGPDVVGSYWSSTIIGSASWSLFFYNDTGGGGAAVINVSRANGYSVRCIKDSLY